MKIEDIKALEQDVSDDLLQNRCIPESVFYDAYVKCVEALRAEAWHPIEKAAELGAKDGRWVLLWNGLDFWDACWNEEWYGVTVSEPTHFRFINPPEGA